MMAVAVVCRLSSDINAHGLHNRTSTTHQPANFWVYFFWEWGFFFFFLFTFVVWLVGLVGWLAYFPATALTVAYSASTACLMPPHFLLLLPPLAQFRVLTCTTLPTPVALIIRILQKYV